MDESTVLSDKGTRQRLGIPSIPITQALGDRLLTIREPETDRPHFRDALRQAGQIMGYTLANGLPYRVKSVKTLLDAEAQQVGLDEQPVLVVLLAAALPLYYGLQEVFPHAEAGFIGTMRDEHTLKPKTTYVRLPDLQGRIVTVIDTMIATQGSMHDGVEIVRKRGAKDIYVCGAIASKTGIERMIDDGIGPSKIYVAAIDPRLTDRGWIDPGLGDAGDRAFGKKVD